MAIGWDKNQSNMLKELFVWDATTMSGLQRNKGDLLLDKKQERMMVYLFETILQLSLCPAHNVSSNPGFEMFNGSFRG
eukprot:scaffold3698_cov269-Chaetoceros_neogracile.AAC.5